MLESSHYDLLAKYDSTEPEFNANELATIFEILNLEPRIFTETNLQEYKALISQTIREQSRVMTELCGEYKSLNSEGLTKAAMRYVVRNIRKVASPFMLDLLAAVVRDGVDSPLRYGRCRHSEI
jgi:hypothetical protein